MKLTKGYSHLFQANIPSGEIKVEDTPTPAPVPAASPVTTPSFDQIDSQADTDFNKGAEPKKSIIPKLVIIGLIVLIFVLIFNLIPKSYEDCTSLPFSKVEGATCTTFYRKSFTKTVTSPIDPSADNSPETNPGYDYPFPSTTPKTASNSAYVPTTKGGTALVTPTSANAPTKAPAKTVTNPPSNTTAPVPTSSPSSDTSVPSTWVKHRYPDQSIAFWLPQGWVGSTAVYHTDTGITNFYLGGPDSIKVAVLPNWNTTGVNNQNTNYQVKDTIPAVKVVGDTYTTVYFERSGQVYQFTCQNSLWSTCHTILQNLEFS